MAARREPVRQLSIEQIQDLAEGRKQFFEVLNLTPEDLLELLNRALSLVRLRRFDDAYRIFKGLAALDQRNPVFASGAASVEVLRKNHAEAVEWAEKAIGLDPDYPTAHLVLGEALAKLGQLEAAVEALERGLELSPPEREAETRRYRMIALSLKGEEPPEPPAREPAER